MSPGLRTLINLHEHHIFSVPFENIDVQLRRPISLKTGDIYSKVVEHNRGGFCYELNYIFNVLLREIGFNTKIISCRIINDGIVGPEFDHMAIITIINNKEYLADVGFGDLFVQPLALKPGMVQFDGRNFFKIDVDQTPAEFNLNMSEDGAVFRPVYKFNAQSRSLDEFLSSCEDKQTNPDSYFVKNTICTLPTDTGRMTIFNDKFIETIYDEKAEMPLKDKESIRNCLEEKFQIRIDK